MTQRTRDGNGWFTVQKNPLSKAGVFPYLGKEIGAAPGDKIFMVRRSADELGSRECMDSFKMIPLIDDHEMLGPKKGTIAAEDRGIHGITGEQVVFDKDTNLLCVNLKVMSDSMERAIDLGKNNLSAGYGCKYIQKSGTYMGQAFDYDQIEIRGNHMALVQSGRMGKEVSVQDGAIYAFDRKPPELENMLTAAQEAALAAIKDAQAAGLKMEGVGQDSTPKEILEQAMTESVVLGAMDESTRIKNARKEADDKAEAKEKAELQAKLDKEAASNGQDSSKEIIALLEKMGKRIDGIESGKAVAAQDAVSSVTARTAALDSMTPHFGALADAGAKTDAEFYGHYNGKMGVKFAEGQEQGAFDAAAPIWLEANKKTDLKVVSALDAKETGSLTDFLKGKATA